VDICSRDFLNCFFKVFEYYCRLKIWEDLG
jgi:hypothetical protein